MRIRLPVHLLFAAALFAAQALAVAHGFEHAVIGHADDHPSVICAHGHVPGYLPAAAINAPAPGPAAPAATAAAVTVFVAAPPPAFRSRAPPFPA